MAQYYYDENGKEHRILSQREKSQEEANKLFGPLLVYGILILIAVAPGMTVTSLFASSIESTLWAWIWSVVFSGTIFGLLYWLYSKTSHVMGFTIASHFVLSALAIWFLFASEPSSDIVKIGKLLLPFVVE